MSLRLRVVLIVGFSLIVLWACAALFMLRGVSSNLDRTLDGRLAMSARMVSGLLERAALSPNLPTSSLTEAVRVNGKEGIACEIRSLRGEVLARTLSGPHSEFEMLPAGLSTRVVAEHKWRIYVLRSNGYQITTADRVDERAALIKGVLEATWIPFAIAILGGLAALWIGIGRGLAPLQELSSHLRQRDADDTSNIGISRSPPELQPVLESLNGLLKQLAKALSDQRAFTDAAAHELRTPLTVVDTHIQIARLSDGEELQDSLSNAEQGVKRLSRTLDQMMALARVEARVIDGDECTSILEVANDVSVQAGRPSRLRLRALSGYQDAGSTIPRSMMHIAIRNLVDNALRYSSPDGAVELFLHSDISVQRIHLEVADRGPGLETAQYEQIGQRFWRGDLGRQQSDGAGLGISIVQTIVGRFGGTLELRSREGGGLIAKISVPIVDPCDG